ncbi:hypothetical protein [Inquilinus limosus]|uniref:hypothetical protein n=1 Tax=Inquilinus limosus TaxID=171674 RepID=UPI00119820BC|nr:hypothetical protein [Inquilinus limosus]
MATNVVPQSTADSHYGSWQALSPLTTALDGAALGGISGKSVTGIAFSFAGTAGKLYRQGAAGWDDVSKSGGYNTPAETFWKFTQYGYDILATNYADPIQTYTMGTSTDFADVSATAPRAKYLMVVREFLVALNTFDIDGQRPLRVRWSPSSAAGGPAGDWTPDPTTQSDFQDLLTGEEILGGVGGEYGLVICRKSIYRMTYVGPPVVFQFDEIVRNRGTIAPGSVATDGQMTIFYSEDGFYACDGAAVTPIGAGKIDRWFKVNAQPSNFLNMSASMDPTRQIYALSFVSVDTPDGNPDTLLLYNWVTDRWSIIRQSLRSLVTFLSQPLSLDQLDTVSTSIDALPASLDSQRWAGGSVYFGAFTIANEFGLFNGAPLPAAIETGEATLGGDLRALLQSVRPLCDGSPTVQVGYRDNQWEDVSLSAAESPTRAGDCKFDPIIDARFHRVRMQIAGNWSQATGVDVMAQPSGLT